MFFLSLDSPSLLRTFRSPFFSRSSKLVSPPPHLVSPPPGHRPSPIGRALWWIFVFTPHSTPFTFLPFSARFARLSLPLLPGCLSRDFMLAILSSKFQDTAAALRQPFGLSFSVSDERLFLVPTFVGLPCHVSIERTG